MRGGWEGGLDPEGNSHGSQQPSFIAVTTPCSPPGPAVQGHYDLPHLRLRCWVCVLRGGSFLTLRPMEPHFLPAAPLVTPAQLFLGLYSGQRQACSQGFPAPALPPTGGGQDLSSAFVRKAGPDVSSDLRKGPLAHTARETLPRGTVTLQRTQAMHSSWDNRAEPGAGCSQFRSQNHEDEPCGSQRVLHPESRTWG